MLSGVENRQRRVTMSEKPTTVMDGILYELRSVGRYTETNRLGNELSKRLGWREIDPIKGHIGHYPHEKGAAYRVMHPTTKQLREIEIDPANLNPYILWARVDIPEPFWCEGPCEKCDERRFEIWAENLK
jgi:hypothetical protein